MASSSSVRGLSRRFVRQLTINAASQPAAIRIGALETATQAAHVSTFSPLSSAPNGVISAGRSHPISNSTKEVPSRSLTTASSPWQLAKDDYDTSERDNGGAEAATTSDEQSQGQPGSSQTPQRSGLEQGDETAAGNRVADTAGAGVAAPRPAVPYHGRPPKQRPLLFEVPRTQEELVRFLNKSWAQTHFSDMVAAFEKYKDEVSGRSPAAGPPGEQAYNLVLLAQNNLMDDVWRIFKRFEDMRAAGLKPSMLTYNILLKAAFRTEDARVAEKVIRLMDENGVKPDRECYNSAIMTLALSKSAETAMELFRRMIKEGLKPGRSTYHELLLCSARMKTKRTAYAVEVMKQMLLERVDVPPRIYQEVILAGVIKGDIECCQLALGELITTRESLDEGTLLSVLNTAARNGAAPLLKLAWDMSVKVGGARAPPPAAHLARVHGMASLGDLDGAFAAVADLEEAHAGPESDLSAEERHELLAPHSSLAPLVAALSRGVATLDTAYYKLAAMQGATQKVPLSAINCVIMGCSNARDMERAFQTFDEIGNTFMLRPDVHTYSALMLGCIRTNQVAAAVRTFETIRGSGLQPDHRAFSLLVEAHVVARDPDAALNALKDMQSAGHVPSRQTLLYVLRRCKREEHRRGVEEMQQLLSELGYTNDEGGDVRREFIQNAFIEWQKAPNRKWNSVHAHKERPSRWGNNKFNRLESEQLEF